MTRKFLAYEQELTVIVKVFQQDFGLLAISPDLEFPAEPNGLSITEVEFRRSQDTLKALDIQWAHSKGFSVKFLFIVMAGGQ